jgi:hypothetical protein
MSVPLSPRKVILGLVLAGAILFFCLILMVGAIAILREAAPKTGYAGLRHIIAAVRHVIAHTIPHHK